MTVELTVYVIPWSHYCKKVEFVADYLGLDVRVFDYIPITTPLPKELKAVKDRVLFPILRVHDTATGSDEFFLESTRICVKLGEIALAKGGEHAEKSRSLFGRSAKEKAEIEARSLELDSTMGLYARKLGYGYFCAAEPNYLSRLFLPKLHTPGGGFLSEIAMSPLRWMSGHGVALFVMERFAIYDAAAEHAPEAMLKQLADLDATSRENGGFLLEKGRHTLIDFTAYSLSRPFLVLPSFQPGARWAEQASILRHFEESAAKVCPTVSSPPYFALIEEQERQKNAGLGWLTDPFFNVASLLFSVATWPLYFAFFALAQSSIRSPTDGLNQSFEKVDGYADTDQRNVSFYDKKSSILTKITGLSAAFFRYMVVLPHAFRGLV